MGQFTNRGKTYETDALGFLLDPHAWDESFAEGMAVETGIENGLNDQHWKVIYFLRRFIEEHGACPPVFLTCRSNDLGLADLRRLFPAGYQRGACKVAGFNYQLGFYNQWVDAKPQEFTARFGEKVYRVDAQGFLLDAKDWDEGFALGTARALRMPGELTDRRWTVIRFLRDSFAATGQIPTVYEACERNGLEVQDLEALFPDGYHRGAVKLAGLRLL
ncbi:MAG: TusE/DsrC/DsvC family sulfur relay protein [Acidobacteriota bacterium]